MNTVVLMNRYENVNGPSDHLHYVFEFYRYPGTGTPVFSVNVNNVNKFGTQVTT